MKNKNLFETALTAGKKVDVTNLFDAKFVWRIEEEITGDTVVSAYVDDFNGCDVLISPLIFEDEALGSVFKISHSLKGFEKFNQAALSGAIVTVLCKKLCASVIPGVWVDLHFSLVSPAGDREKFTVTAS